MLIHDDALIVNSRRSQAPSRILLKRGSETVEWAARDIAGTTEGVYLFIADMAGHGWTAIRDGDAILLHPIYDATPVHLGWPV